MLLLSPQNFNDYELIDCGDFEKLERFGKHFTIRPEPQAVWSKAMPEKEWLKMAHVRFDSTSSSSGTWKKLKDMPDRWTIEYALNSKNTSPQSPIKFRLALTAFKHVGIFPEQAVNWDYIADCVSRMKSPRVLNLFAYTGGASLAAKAAGADVVHLDSIKQVVTWANSNMELSNLRDIRWIVEDAMAFVKKEVRRGKKYNGIILDPPAYGHGTDGQKWKLEEMISEMMQMVASLLEDQNRFLVLNTYSLGFSSLIVENILRERFPDQSEKDFQTGELYLQSRSGVKLPLGVFGRFCQFNV